MRMTGRARKPQDLRNLQSGTRNPGSDDARNRCRIPRDGFRFLKRSSIFGASQSDSAPGIAHRETEEPMPRVTVLHFSHLRAATGNIGEETYDVPEGARLSDLIDEITRRHPAVAKHLPSLMITCNEEWTTTGQPVRDGDVVGLMPPVSGG